MKRRDFLLRSTLLGAAALAGSRLVPSLRAATPIPTPAASGNTEAGSAATPPDLAVVEGADTFAATLRAIELAGGIRRFVKPGAKVGLLINAPGSFRNPGSFTSPDVALAVLQLCLDAGAAEIVSLIDLAPDYWTRTPRGAQLPQLIAALRKNTSAWADVEIPRGIALKTASINRGLLDSEVLINLPITKHHAGAGYTGCLKNLMGCCQRNTNRFFHTGSEAKENFEKAAFLSQCIADLNLLRRPTLNVCDATEFLSSNGPAGPGDIKRAHKVIVGVDSVSVDAYGCTLLGLRADQVVTIVKAAAHGLGQPDLTKLTVREAKL